MSVATIVESLQGVPFFQDIAAEHLERLASIAQPVEYPARSEIFHEHDKSQNVYVILSGQVSLVIRQPKVGSRQLLQVGDGELVGWSALLGRPRLSDTALTLTETKALAIDGQQALALCKEDPELGFVFMQRVAKELAGRLSATRLKLLETSGTQLPSVQIESD